jgi:hypothetical protein
MLFFAMPFTWLYNLPRNPFFHSLYQSRYSLPVDHEFLKSSSFNIVNPRRHRVATDTVSQVFPASAVAGLSDEKVLALFTCGFFGGVVFALERWFLAVGGWNLFPARYTGEYCRAQLSDFLTIYRTSELNDAFRLQRRSRCGNDLDSF